MRRGFLFRVIGVLSLFPLVLIAQQPSTNSGMSVPNKPFVVEPSAFFQPFEAFARFYTGSPYHPSPTFEANPPYNPLPPPEVPTPEVQACDSTQLSELNDQIRELRDELQRMKEAQGNGALDASPPGEQGSSSISDAPFRPAVLAFRDGRRIEAESYVIMGDAVWIGGDDSGRVPIADLDVEATQKLNQARGVQFRLPGDAAAPRSGAAQAYVRK